MTELIRKPTEKPTEENPYAVFNLTRNPFPPEGTVRVGSEDPVENGTVFNTAIREESLEKFKNKFIYPDSMGRINPMGYLWSPGGHENRGLGKTAILRFYQVGINKDYGQSLLGKKYKACVLYLYPREDMKSLNHLCQLALRRVAERENGQSLFEDILSIVRYRAIEEKFSHITEKLDNEEKIKNLSNNDFIRELGLDFEALTTNVVNIFTANGVRSKVAEIISTEGLEAYCRVYLSPRKSLMESVELFFSDLVGMLSAAYFTHAYILVDDLYEMFLKANKKDAERFAEGLNYWQFRSQDSLAVKKRFYGFIFTIHAKAEEWLAPFWRQSGLSQFCPLGVRGTNSLLVDILSPEEARKIIATYLNYENTYNYRGKTYNGHRMKLKDVPEPLFPFTKEAIDKLSEYNGGHPRRMLDKEFGAYRILEEAIAAKVEKIDADFVEKVLQEKRPTGEEVEEDIFDY